jgi:cytochrome c5
VAELRTLDDLEATVKEALTARSVSATQRAEGQAALSELRMRAERVDASCEVCHAAAVSEGRAQERAA